MPEAMGCHAFLPLELFTQDEARWQGTRAQRGKPRAPTHSREPSAGNTASTRGHTASFWTLRNR